MIETFVDYALGPHGRFLSELYMEHQFLINTAVVGISIYNLFFTKRKKSSSVKATAESK